MYNCILSGGTGTKELDEYFLNKLKFQSKVLLITLARENSEKTKNWFISKYCSTMNFTVDVLSDVQPQSLQSYDAIYISGGNTFRLLYTLRNLNLLIELKNYIQSGKLVYGGSAGAIILGKSIQIAELLEENISQIENNLGLDLIEGFSILPHFKKELNLKKFSKIICLTEESGIIIENKKINIFGEVYLKENESINTFSTIKFSNSFFTF